ncbi:DUF423 domain-containing protein [Hyphococcus sp.]|uniref:DUF423 domain-containing protein n=1 Tax=Hyphococcus sp. TaxID=2038636 RepID=UPI00208545F2|nr:MAG: DUF423 domain-containing protein [Marinicaulis sp.]
MNRLTFAAAMTGFLAVALGAFGAHGFESRLSAEAQGWWETATFYGLTHAVAALALSLSASSVDRLYRRAGWAFVAGAAIFAGSLYAMSLGAPRWFGATTPLGGLLLLGGWTMTALAAFKQHERKT